ncbi:hypothetical protein BO79DRAFT_256638 [Aspergillus costaricaensis CBS 115574]|uniref:Uncharacterized protein n=1 Tax=Aspergillus costaricaensis CBS 115574 TaxID=1448317 RepID=A0ACD1IBK6_9EURO|nr:hypothetical protein BO79DRAFT_256638 [Aspergillus costaricaensis CBS 115574]RAK87144.1 hypothetical protein BO79DRAFT_256638 [Aspergillus costaricaensis CBS 115574]
MKTYEDAIGMVENQEVIRHSHSQIRDTHETICFLLIKKEEPSDTTLSNIVDARQLIPQLRSDGFYLWLAFSKSGVINFGAEAGLKGSSPNHSKADCGLHAIKLTLSMVWLAS